MCCIALPKFNSQQFYGVPSARGSIHFEFLTIIWRICIRIEFEIINQDNFSRIRIDKRKSWDKGEICVSSSHSMVLLIFKYVYVYVLNSSFGSWNKRLSMFFFPVGMVCNFCPNGARLWFWRFFLFEPFFSQGLCHHVPCLEGQLRYF